MKDQEMQLKKFGKIRILKFVTRNEVCNVFLNDEWLGAVNET